MRERNVTNAQVRAGHDYLRQLLTIATAVEVVVAMGKPAQASVHQLDSELAERGIRVLDCIHPSPRNNARGGPQQVVELFEAVASGFGLR